jgi:hypothetical protein
MSCGNLIGVLLCLPGLIQTAPVSGQPREGRKITVELPTPRDPARGHNPQWDAQEIKEYADFLEQRKVEALVGDPGVIVLDVFLAGLDRDRTPLPNLAKMRPFNQSRGWDAGLREIFSVARHDWGETEQGRTGRWTVTPEKLYVGGLRFALLGELGIIGRGSNARYGGKGTVEVPVLVPNRTRPGGYELIREDIGVHPCSHFVITEAYWVYKAEKNGDVQYFAVELNGMARTTMHCPFGPTYEQKMQALRQQYPDGILGRPMEEKNILMDAGQTALYGLPTRLGNDAMFTAREALKSMPSMLEIGTWEDVKRAYPKIRAEPFKLRVE